MSKYCNSIWSNVLNLSAMSYPRPRMCSAQPFLQWVHVGRPFWWVVRNGLGGQTLTLSTRKSLAERLPGRWVHLRLLAQVS